MYYALGEIDIGHGVKVMSHRSLRGTSQLEAMHRSLNASVVGSNHSLELFSCLHIEWWTRYNEKKARQRTTAKGDRFRGHNPIKFSSGPLKCIDRELMDEAQEQHEELTGGEKLDPDWVKLPKFHPGLEFFSGQYAEKQLGQFPEVNTAEAGNESEITAEVEDEGFTEEFAPVSLDEIADEIRFLDANRHEGLDRVNDLATLLLKIAGSSLTLFSETDIKQILEALDKLNVYDKDMFKKNLQEIKERRNTNTSTPQAGDSSHGSSAPFKVPHGSGDVLASTTAPLTSSSSSSSAVADPQDRLPSPGSSHQSHVSRPSVLTVNVTKTTAGITGKMQLSRIGAVTGKSSMLKIDTNKNRLMTMLFQQLRAGTNTAKKDDKQYLQSIAEQITTKYTWIMQQVFSVRALQDKIPLYPLGKGIIAKTLLSMQKKEARSLALQSLNRRLPNARSVLPQPLGKSLPAATERPAPTGEVHVTPQPAMPTEPVIKKNKPGPKKKQSETGE